MTTRTSSVFWTFPAFIRPGEPTPPLHRRPDPHDPVRAEIVDTRRPQAAGGFFYFRRPVMTTSQVQSGTQDFETSGGQLPYVDVVHAAGPATDVDQDQPRHWRPREPRVDHWCENHGPYIKGSRLHRPQDHRKLCRPDHRHRRRRDRDAGQGMPTAPQAGPGASSRT